MKLLLDTHAVLWWMVDDPRLSSRARSLIAARDNQVFFSAVSGWEIAIKARLGRLKLPESPANFIPDQLVKNSFQVLPVELSHVLSEYDLPAHHADPFDRLLVCQALVEGMALLSSDSAFGDYGVDVVW